MSRGLAGLISALGTMAGGYMQGQQLADEKKRRDAQFAQQQEQYAYDKQQRDNAAALDKDVSSAMAERGVTDATPTDVPLPLQVPTYQANGQSYGDEASARMALNGVNSQAAKYQRAAQAASAHGVAGIDKAQLYDALAKRALEEGTDKTLAAIQASAPTVDAVKQAGGSVTGSVGQQAADAFNQTGGLWKMRPDTVVQHFIDKDPAGREFVNSRVIGADGKPVVDDVAHAGLFLQDYKTRLAAQQEGTRAYQTGQQITQAGARDAESARHDKAVEDETARNNAALRGIQQQQVGIAAGQLKLAQGKDAREATMFKNQTIDGQLEQIKQAVGPLSPEDEKAYRKKLLGIGANKDQDSAFINDVVKKWGENNPTATAQQVAQYRADLSGSLTQAASNKQVEGALHDAFVKNPFGSDGYAQTYSDAKSQLGMTDKQLADLGYKPPAGRMAGRGIAPTVQQIQASGATVIGAPVDVRQDPTIATLNQAIGKLDANDPKNVKTLMDLGTAKNVRLKQLQQNYGDMAQLVAD